MHVMEIRRLEFKKTLLEAELRGLSLISPSFEVVEGQNPNRNTSGIGNREIAVGNRINQVDKLIIARNLLLAEVENFLNFCDAENKKAFEMRFIQGFSFSTVERRTGIPYKTFSRRVDTWIEKYNENLLFIDL